MPEDTLELVGRQRELDLVTVALEDARAGRARSLAFVGEPGIGKSSLLDAAHRLADALGFEVLRTSGSPAERELPYAGLLAVLRPLRSLAAALPETQRSALDAALDEGEERAGSFAVGAATLGVLAAAAELRPVVVVVDDHHWLDQPTCDALAFAARRMSADSVAVILAARPEGRDDATRTAASTWDVTALDDEAALEVLTSAAERLDDRVRAAVLSAAHGNPLALLELPRRLTPGQRTGADPLPPVLPGGDVVARSFASAAATLPESGRISLAAAALLEGDAARELVPVLELLGLSIDDLESAESANLLRVVAGRLGFRHPLVRAAALEGVDDPTRRRIHAAFAAVLPPGERRALHLAEAASGPDEEAARTLEAVAATVPAVTASALLARAADLSPDAAARAARLAHAARRALDAGRLDRARSLAEGALTVGAAQSGTALRALGQVARNDRPPAVAIDLLGEAAAAFESSDPALALECLGEAFQASFATGDPSVTASVHDSFVTLADRHPGWTALRDLVEGIVAIQRGDGAHGVELVTRFLDTTTPADLAQSERDRGLRGMATLWLDDHQRTLAELDPPIADARASGRLSALPRLLGFAGFAQARLGRFEAAYATLSEALATAEELGQLVTACDLANAVAGLEARLGRYDRCRVHAERSIALAAELGLDWFGVHAKGHLAVSALGAGQPDRAIAILEGLHAELRARGVVDPGEYDHPNLAEALVRVGRTDAAARVVAEYEALVADVPWPFERALALRAAALVAADDEVGKLFEGSLAAHPEGALFERARTHLLFGERLRRSGQRRASREQLRRAESLFEQLGSSGWAERCRVELRASGARLRSGAEARDELTPQELQVALEVARGLTNREIAQTLFLSPKTVEFHLTRIYRKLGLNARAELVERFADQV